MANDPNPSLQLTSLSGATRTLDDWTTVFNLVVVLLPGRPEAAAWVPVIDRIYGTLGDADVRTAICIGGNETIARKVLGDATDRWLVFCDPELELANSLALERLPAFVHLRQDTTLVTSAEGWDVDEWQRVSDEIARRKKWSRPRVAGRGCPPATPGWPLSA